MQQAVFLFTQIFFVVLAVSVVGMVIYAVIKRRDKSTTSTTINEVQPSKSIDK